MFMIYSSNLHIPCTPQQQLTQLWRHFALQPHLPPAERRNPRAGAPVTLCCCGGFWVPSPGTSQHTAVWLCQWAQLSLRPREIQSMWDGALLYKPRRNILVPSLMHIHSALSSWAPRGSCSPFAPAQCHQKQRCSEPICQA